MNLNNSNCRWFDTYYKQGRCPFSTTNCCDDDCVFNWERAGKDISQLGETIDTLQEENTNLQCSVDECEDLRRQLSDADDRCFELEKLYDDVIEHISNVLTERQMKKLLKLRDDYVDSYTNSWLEMLEKIWREKNDNEL